MTRCHEERNNKNDKNMHIIYTNKYLLLGSLMALLVMSTCSHRPSWQRSEEATHALKCIDDSIDAQSPHTKQMIEQGMAKAEDSLTFYECYARLGKYYCLSNTPDSLNRYIDGTIAFCQRTPESPRSNSLLAYAYNCRAINYHNFHRNPQQVIDLYQKAYSKLSKSDAEDQLPKVCANMGDAYLFNNQLPEAASWYRRALFLVDSLNLPKQENITLYMGLATIYLQLNDFATSLKYYQQTEQYSKQMSVSMQAYYLNNYGNYYYYTKDYAASLRKFLQLKAFLEKSKKTDTFDMYLCKLNMADVYLNLDSIRLSEKYLDEVEPFMTRNGDVVATYYCNTIRIGQAVKKGDFSAVGRILAQEKQSDGIAFNLRQIRNQYLRKYYVRIGNYQKAYQNLSEDIQMNDSLEHNRVNMRASEIMERFTQDTIMLHHQLLMEHKNAMIQKANNKVLIAVGIIIVLTLLFLLWILYARRRDEQKKMDIMMLKLGSARNRISPHFVFNVLNNKIINSEEKEAAELLDLTKLIRANLDLSCRHNVMLAEELAFVEQYVNVERPLLGDDFTFRIDKAPKLDTQTIQIPSMLLQILVENAIVHGLSGWEGKKTLTINITQEEDGISISVIDNGPGFDITQTGKKRTGLHIVSQTIATINARNKKKMRFSLHNIQQGCEASLYIPAHIKML